MENASIHLQKVENGWQIIVTGRPDLNPRNLVAVNDTDAKKVIHEAVDKLFEPPKMKV